MQANPLTPGQAIPPRPTRPPTVGSGPAAAGDSGEPLRTTRAGVVWAATVAALVLLILMIAFILQNQEPVRIQYIGLVGSLPLGLALFIAAIGGGSLVAVAAAVRITQLRFMANSVRRRPTVRRSIRARNPLFRHGHHLS